MIACNSPTTAIIVEVDLRAGNLTD